MDVVLGGQGSLQIQEILMTVVSTPSMLVKKIQLIHAKLLVIVTEIGFALNIKNAMVQLDTLVYVHQKA
jgi:hypothetical protein